jgi:PBS lyase HEAT-like repeat-containing protein
MHPQGNNLLGASKGGKPVLLGLKRRWGLSRRGACSLTAAALVSTGLCGCAGFWDNVTSRDFQVKSLFVKLDPMVVLRDSNDGDKRAAALRALREPLQDGGSEQDQEVVVKILSTTAVSERQALCRMAAIQSLAGFKDPRAVQGLTEAYYRADSFPPDQATVIRCQALTALGETRNPTAVDLLVKVVREPPTEGSDVERQQAMDVRIAATRALRHFNQSPATDTLVQVLKTEKNVALRDSAHESLEVATGKKLSAEPKEWDEALRPQEGQKNVAAAEKGSPFKLLGFFQGK